MLRPHSRLAKPSSIGCSSTLPSSMAGHSPQRPASLRTRTELLFRYHLYCGRALSLCTISLPFGQQLEVASDRATLDDAALGKALDYYEHALFLSNAVPATVPVSMRTVDHLQAAAFLFLWKALSTIVGDPSTDRDYQSRYRALGLDYSFFRDTIEEIRRLRNEEDVAHYRVDLGGLEVLRRKFEMAKTATKRVLVAYIDQLRAPRAQL